MWRVIHGQSLLYRRWDDEAVLYNDLSGATHLLGPAALCLLEALRAGPAGVDALSAVLLAEFEVDASSLPEELASLLDSLARLDLIEPCTC
ncbi:HPr-rel-A system PqqD family peptide chaperone [Massilia consociata]|uniref:HPr-rel-A system PqqD family peptide chaperone n=1 Tax=Massilia consociata TaxID=760117 RepID=A0ABV6FC39_9BURK